MARRELLTIDDKSPRYPRILIGTLDERVMPLPRGGSERVYAARCERCGVEVTRATSRRSAEADLLRHRQRCRPAVRPPRHHTDRA